MIPAIIAILGSSLMSTAPLYAYDITNNFGFGININDVNISSMPSSDQTFLIEFYYGGYFDGSNDNFLNFNYALNGAENPSPSNYFKQKVNGFDFYVYERLSLDWITTGAYPILEISYNLSCFPVDTYTDGSKNLKYQTWASTQPPASITNTFISGYSNAVLYTHRSGGGFQSSDDSADSSTTSETRFINYNNGQWVGGVFNINYTLDNYDINEKTYFSVNAFTCINYDDNASSTFNDGYENGYNNGYNTGYDTGYNDGITEGQANTNNLFSLINSAFSAVTSFFNMEILPGLTLGTLILIPLGLGIIYLIIRLISA